MARLVGRVLDWNDEKGFGFVEPNGGGERAFVHVSEFQRGARRPASSDLISYLPARDASGRLQAKQIRHAGQKPQPASMPTRIPRAAFGISALCLLVAAAALGLLPYLLAGMYLALSGLSYVMYFFDKSAAQKGGSRTPESSLHMVDLLGGWPGALIAQQHFRHKTIKKPFQFVFWLTVTINLLVAWWLVSSGLILELSRQLGL